LLVHQWIIIDLRHTSLLSLFSELLSETALACDLSSNYYRLRHYCLSVQSLTRFIDFDKYFFNLYLDISWHTSVNFYLDLYLSMNLSQYLSTYLCQLLSQLISLNISLSLMLLDWHLSSLSSRSHNPFSRILLSPYSLIVYLFLYSPLALIHPLVVISLVILLYTETTFLSTWLWLWLNKIRSKNKITTW
jgi:hypothetical protein